MIERKTEQSRNSNHCNTLYFLVFFIYFSNAYLFLGASSSEQETPYDRTYLQSILRDQQNRSLHVDWENLPQVVSYLNCCIHVSRNSDGNQMISKVLFIPWESIEDSKEAKICEEIIRILHMELLWQRSQYNDARIVLHVSSPPASLASLLESEKLKIPRFEYVTITWEGD